MAAAAQIPPHAPVDPRPADLARPGSTATVTPGAHTAVSVAQPAATEDRLVPAAAAASRRVATPPPAGLSWQQKVKWGGTGVAVSVTTMATVSICLHSAPLAHAIWPVMGALLGLCGVGLVVSTLVKRAAGRRLAEQPDSSRDQAIYKNAGRVQALCTGGLVGHMVTREPGASDFLLVDAVTYANSAKTRLLGVDEDVLRGHGAVSAEVAAAMAEGVRRVSGANLALSLTGIAGPSGGSAQKPVGTVFVALASPEGTQVVEKHFPGDRLQIQTFAAYAGLLLVRDACR